MSTVSTLLAVPRRMTIPTSSTRMRTAVTGGGAAPSGGRGAQPGHPALGALHHVGQIERVEVGAHVLADVGPHRQQDALALVVAGAVLMGDAEVARHDGSVHGRHD